jgi:uncharacterized repeat protein (TIGR01451 family)
LLKNSARLLGVGLAVALLATAADAAIATFVVTNTGDSGAGSLRQAMLDANATPGADLISFAIPGAGVHTISVASPLPDITEAVTIDGATQPGATTMPLIEVTTSGDLHGFLIRASDTAIRGLVINRFTTAIIIRDGFEATVSGNFIGTDSAGTAVVYGPVTSFAGVQVSGIARVGGPAAADGNVIAAYSVGVLVNGSTSGTTIQNNFIGTDRSKTVALSGMQVGVSLEQPGPTMTRDNVIANQFHCVGGFSYPGHSILTNLLYDCIGEAIVNAEAEPVNLLSAATDGVTTVVGGNTASALNDVYLLQLFATPSNVREARSFVGEGSITHLTNDFTFTFGPTAPGAYVTMTQTNVANGTTTALSNALQVVVAPGVSESFLPVSIGQNDVSILTIRLTNVEPVTPMTDVSLVNTLPSGMVLAALPAPVSTCTGASFGVPVGEPIFSVSGMSVPANGSCEISVAVTAAAAGVYVHTTAVEDVDSSSHGSNFSAATATLSVLPHPSVSKQFVPPAIQPSGTSTLTITLANSSATAVTGAAFTDTYPAGVVNNGAPSSNCGGSLTSTGNSVSLSGGIIPANGTCFVSINVTSSTSGSYGNLLPVGGLTSANAGANIAAAAATLTVNPLPPVVTKAFNPTTIAPSAPSTLTVTLTNNSASAVTGAAFTDPYPTGVINSGTPPTSNCGGVLSTTSNSVSLNGGTVPPNGTCFVSIDVTSATSGSYSNVLPIGSVTATNTGANTVAANATLTVNPLPPVVTKAFSPTTIAPTATSTLTVTLTNNSAVAVNGVAFTDTYPAGVINSGTPPTSNCGPVTTTSNSVSLSGGTIPANGTCSVSVLVTSATANSYQNNLPVGAVTATNAAASTAAASATLSVVPLGAIGATKSFAPASFQQGGASTMTIALTNVNPNAINALAFTDNYPGGLTNAAPLTVTNTCGGAVTTTAGGSSLALSGGTIAANSGCSISVLVTASVAGTYTNTIAANGITSSNANPNASPATASVTANPLPASPSLSFVPNVISNAGTSRLTITLANASAAAITGVAINHAFPAGITATATPNVSSTCGAGVTAAPLGSSIALTNGIVPANGGCTIAVDVRGNAPGATDTIAAGAVTAANAAPSTATATATLTVLFPGPGVAKSFSATTLAIGAPSTLTVTLTNPNATAIVGATFTDNYPAGMINTSAPAPTSTCGGAATAPAGGTFLTLTGGTIPANGSCTVSAIITVTTGAPLTNIIPSGGVTSANADANSGQAGSATVNATNIPILPEHMLLILGALLATMAIFAMRR